jgi:transcriptional regulator with XRE-family HTH domain
VLGDYVRRLRKAKGLSQHDLAEAAKLDQSYISRLERGVHTWAMEGTLVKLSFALDVSVDALKRASGYLGEGAAAPEDLPGPGSPHPFSEMVAFMQRDPAFMAACSAVDLDAEDLELLVRQNQVWMETVLRQRGKNGRRRRGTPGPSTDGPGTDGL